MGADHVVIEHVPIDSVDHLPGCDVLVDIYILVFQAAKKTFCADIAKRVFLEPPDRSTESHWRAEIRAGGAGPRAIEANTNIKSHLS